MYIFFDHLYGNKCVLKFSNTYLKEFLTPFVATKKLDYQNIHILRLKVTSKQNVSHFPLTM